MPFTDQQRDYALSRLKDVAQRRFNELLLKHGVKEHGTELYDKIHDAVKTKNGELADKVMLDDADPRTLIKQLQEFDIPS